MLCYDQLCAYVPPSVLDLLPIQAPTGHWAELPAPWTRCSSSVALRDSVVHLSVPISHPPHPSFPPGSHAFVLCAGSKEMMELQLCLEKGHRLGGRSMNINGARCEKAQMRTGNYQKGQDVSWGEGCSLQLTLKIEHSWASVSSGSNQQRTEYIGKNNSRKFPKVKLEFAITNGKSLQSISIVAGVASGPETV